MFALIVAALKITYIVLQLYCLPMIKLKGIVTYVMHNVLLVNFFLNLLADTC